MNNIGGRYSHDLCRWMMIPAILHGIMFLIFCLTTKISFKYNMAKLVTLGTAVAKLKSVNYCAKVAKQDSNDAMGL